METLEERGMLATLLHTLLPDTAGPQNESWFGQSVATTADYLVAGAPQSDFAGFVDSGEAFVYNATTKALVARLSNPFPGATELFGNAVAVSGNTVVVGAPQDNTYNTLGGAAFAFRADTGQFLFALLVPTRGANDKIGAAVAIDGNVIAVGAPVDDGTAADTGAVHLFDATTGAFLRTIANPSPQTGDQFGASVALDGNLLVVGAPGDDTHGTDAGKAWTFNVSTGAQLKTLFDIVGAAGDLFGAAVAIDGGRVAVSAPSDDTAALNAGAVYLYDSSTGDWQRTLSNPSPVSGDNFGNSVSLEGNTVLVGANNAEHTAVLQSGLAYVMSATTGAMQYRLDNPLPITDDQLGTSVALASGRAFVGGGLIDRYSLNSGQVYEFNPATGTLVGNLNNSAYASREQYSDDLVLTENRIIVGNWRDSTLGINSGQVDIYDRATGALLTRLYSADSTSREFGRSIAASGNLLAVGSESQMDVGRVEIFDLTTFALLRTISSPQLSSDSTFGVAIALEGNRLAISAPWDSTVSTNNGRAYLFDAATGTLQFTYTNPDATAGSEMGFQMKMSGDNLAISSDASPAGMTDSGSVVIFNTATGAYRYTIANPNPTNADDFGDGLAIDGNNLIIGAPGEDINSTNTGRAYHYDLTTGTQVGFIAEGVSGADRRFGGSIGLSGNKVLFGVPSETTNTGLVKVFDLPTRALAETIGNPTPVTGDQFGSSVAIMGTTIVVAAPFDDTSNVDQGAIYVLWQSNLTASLSGGNLTITDATPTVGSTNLLTVQISGSDLVISDAVEQFSTVPASGVLSDGNRTLRIPLSAVTGSLALDLKGGADVVTLDLASGDVIPAGGITLSAGDPTTAVGDRLVITGAGQGTQSYNYGALGAGSLVLENFGTITYTGLENLDNYGSGTDTVINLPTAAASTLGDDGVVGNGLSRISAAVYYTTTSFASPTGLLTINRGASVDLLTMNALPDFTGSLQLSSDATRFGGITIGGATTFAPNKSFTAFSGGTINFSGTSADLALSGTGSATITSSRNVQFTTGASLTTVDGDILLSAHQQANSIIANFNGIQVDGGLVESTGAGNVTLLGKGGIHDFSNNVGVKVINNGRVSASGGNLSVTGTGGGSFSSFGNIGVSVTYGGALTGGPVHGVTVVGVGGNTSETTGGGDGVYIFNGNARITTTGGPIHITATGSTGFDQAYSSLIQAGGDGTVTILGQATVSSTAGVGLQTGGTITSSGGNVTVEGRGRKNVGVRVEYGGLIKAGGLGSTTVLGIGDYQNLSTNGNDMHGVLVEDQGEIASSGGPLTVTGFGGSGPGTGLNGYSGNMGVRLYGGKISGGGTATVTVEGTGGSPGGPAYANHGVFTTGYEGGVFGGGQVIVRGWAGTSSVDGHARGIYAIGGSTIASSGAANVTVEGWGSVSSVASGNAGVGFGDGYVKSAGGNLLIRGYGGGSGTGSGLNVGVDIYNSSSSGDISTTGAGTITIEGFGGNPASTAADNFGVRLHGTSAKIIANTGKIQITGTGGGSAGGSGNTGIVMRQNALVTSAGEIVLNGIGGPGTNSYGIEIGNYARVNSTAGTVTVSTPTPSGLYVAANGTIGNAGSLGSIELVADQMSFISSFSIELASTRSVTIRPATPGLPIVLGGPDVPGSALGISSAEFSNFSNAGIVIGGPTAGPITFVGDVIRFTSANITLIPGTNQNLSLGNFQFNATTSGTITINATGTGSITTGDTAGTDITAGTVNLNAGTGNIGTPTNPLRIFNGTVNATTAGNLALTNTGTTGQFTTIGPGGWNAASAYFGGGNFVLGGPERLLDTMSVYLAGNTSFKLNGFNETVLGVAGDSTTFLGNGVATSATLTTTATSGTYNLASLVGGSFTNDRTINLVKNGDATLLLNGINNFTGTFQLQGLVVLGHINALGTNAGSTTIAPGGTLDLNGLTLISAEPITVSGSGLPGMAAVYNSSATTALAPWLITLAGDADIGGIGQITLSGVIDDGAATFGIKKVASGTLSLTAANLYNGLTTVSTGQLLLNGASLASAVTTQGSGIVGGVGAASNQLTVAAGGAVSPGVNGAGTLTVNRVGLQAVTLESGAAFNAQFASAISFDVLAANGLVTLGSAGNYPTLNLSSLSGYVPTVGGKLVIVQNDSTDPIDGYFVAGVGSSQPAGTLLSEGMLVTDNFLGSGFGATISYVGGTGNDVVLNVSSTNISLMGGNVIIADSSGSGKDDNLTILRSGADLLISDPVNPLYAFPGFTQVNPSTISIPFANVTGNVQVNTLAGNDRLTIDFTGGDAIPAGGIVFNGGTPSTTNADTLAIAGTGLGGVTYYPTNVSDGSLSFSSFGTVGYSAVEAISHNGVAATLDINLPTTVTNSPTLADDGTLGNGLLRLTGGSFTPFTFANPTAGLTVNRGQAADLMFVNAVADFTASLTIGSAAMPFAGATFSGGATLAAGRNLTVDAVGTINFSSSSSDWALSGTGAALLTTARNIVFASGSTLSVVNGDLTLSANQQTPATNGDFKGIELGTATVSSSGAGQVTVSGRGGNGNSGSQYGVYLLSGAVIRGGTSGLLRVTGTGGLSSFDNDTGVKLNGNGGTITSLGANVEVIGQAGGNSTNSDFARGVDVESTTGTSAISAGGGGSVMVRGTGAAIGGSSAGVRVYGGNASITSNAGGLQIIGQGGAGAANEQVGVLMDGGLITAGSGGNLLIQGTGGAAALYRGFGVWVQSVAAPATVSSSGSSTQITGVAPNADFYNAGVVFELNTNLSVGATGSLVINGSANPVGPTADGDNDGVRINGNLTSSGASVTMIGRGGAGTNSDGVAWGSGNVSLAAAPFVRIDGQASTDAGSFAFAWGSGSTFIAPANGTLEIVADTLSSNLTRDFNLGTGHVSIRPSSVGKPIAIAPISSVLFGNGYLVLMETFLDRLLVDSMEIGTADSGTITFAGFAARPVRTDMVLNTGGAILFADPNSPSLNTAGGSLRLNSGLGGVVPGTQTQEIVVGTGAANRLTFGPGSDLVAKITSPLGTPTGVQQLGVFGEVDITDVDLVVENSVALWPMIGYVLVENDGTEPIIGTFNGLPEGSLIDVGGMKRKLTYVGGTGNDVELVANAMPIMTPVVAQTVNEDSGATALTLTGITAGGSESQALRVTATSNNPGLIPDPVVVYTSANTTGTLTFTPSANQNGSATITVRLRDAGFDGIFDTLDDSTNNSSFVVTVLEVNDAPSFLKGGDQSISYNRGAQTVAGWATAISVGPANEAQTLQFQLTGNTNTALFAVQPAVAADGTLTYTPRAGAFGTATITLVAQDSGGTANGGSDSSLAQTFTITIAPPATLQVTSFTPTTTGASFVFSRNLDLAALNLYSSTSNPLGPADIILLGANVGPIKGSAIVDPNSPRITFVATAGRLPADDYTVTLRSAANGFRDTNGELLDGNGDETAGDAFVANFTVGADTVGAVTLSIGNFARGPQQAVNLPASATSGVPISLSNGEGITAATFELRYNPALLQVGGATVAPGLPVGASVSVDTSTPGIAILQFASVTPLAAGTTRFVDLQMTVPSTAPYRSKAVLDLSNIVLNGGSVPALDDDGVQVAAYFADVSGNGTYSALDASLIARLGVGIDSGLDEYQLLDPAIIGDLTGNGSITATDTALMLQASVGIPVAEIPTPLPTVSLTQGGPDPKLSIPQNLTAAAGSALTIPVDIDSIVDLTGNGLAAADLVIYFDPTVFEFTSAALGRLLAHCPGWMISSRIDPLAGRIDLSLAGTTSLEGQFHGELVQLQATVKSTAAVGSTAINLAASSRSRATQLNEGYLTLIPAPTDAANDSIDGRVQITNDQVVEPTARLIDNQLLITGTAAGDRILVGHMGDELRVRVGQRLLGTFAAARGIAISAGSGDDFIYVSPYAPATVISSDRSERDLTFAAENTQLIDSQLSSGAAATLQPGMSEQDLALLQLLAHWDREYRDSPTTGRSNNVRRR